jgi:hypothetical protein
MNIHKIGFNPQACAAQIAAKHSTAASPGARTFLSAETYGRQSAPSACLLASNLAADRNVRAPMANQEWFVS